MNLGKKVEKAYDLLTDIQKNHVNELDWHTKMYLKDAIKYVYGLNNYVNAKKAIEELNKKS